MADHRPFEALRELRIAINEAEQLDRSVNEQTSMLIGILRGRLRHASGYQLAALKKELAAFNAHTQRWKD